MRHARALRLARLLAGVAAFIKPSGASALLLAGVWWFIADRRNVRGMLRLIVGFAVVPLLSIAHGAIVGLDAYLASFIERRLLLYSVLATPGTEQFARLRGPISVHG